MIKFLDTPATMYTNGDISNIPIQATFIPTLHPCKPKTKSSHPSNPDKTGILPPQMITSLHSPVKSQILDNNYMHDTDDTNCTFVKTIS